MDVQAPEVENSIFCWIFELNTPQDIQLGVTGRTKLKVRGGKCKTGSFSCGVGCTRRPLLPCREQGSACRCCTSGLGEQTQLCPISVSCPPARYVVGWTGSEQGGGQPNLSCVWTRAMVEHTKLIQSFCSCAHPRMMSGCHSKRW